MQIRTLELFRSVAELRSISRAAGEHEVTQSAVSQAMQQLEESLGTQLLDRSRRPLALTATGELYYAGVRRLLRGYERLEQEIRSLSGQLAGRLTVGAIYSVGSTYLPAAREAFRGQHPDVQLRLEYGSCEQIAAMVESGEADLGLVSYPQATRRLTAIRWLEEPMRVVCAAAHRFADLPQLDLADLNGCEWVGFERSLFIRRQIDSFLSLHHVNVDVTMEFDNIDTIIRCLQANVSLSILPEAAVQKELAAGTLRVVPCPKLQLVRPLGIVQRKSSKPTAAAAALIHLLLQASVPSPSAFVLT